MNPKIKKTQDELERTKDKIAELQALVPQLERSITDMENTEIIKAVRSANIALADLPAFISSLKQASAPAAREIQTGGAYSGEYNNDVSKDNKLFTLDGEDDADV